MEALSREEEKLNIDDHKAREVYAELRKQINFMNSRSNLMDILHRDLESHLSTHDDDLTLL
jgi:hypothetical protein